jgi:hypothetical protein
MSEEAVGTPIPDLIDELDRKQLLAVILTRALQDYVKLQPRRARTKVYLQEAFESAQDMLFDPTYEMLFVKDLEGNPMTLRSLVAEVMETERADLDRLRLHAIEEAVREWNDRPLDTLEIPESLVVDGHVYSIFHTTGTPFVNWEHKELYLNKDTSDTENQETLIQLAMEVAFRHCPGPRVSQENIHRLGSIWFRMLRMNSCFIGE